VGSTKPNGQPRRKLDTRRAEREFGFKAQVNFEQGIEQTIRWYREHQLSSPRTRIEPALAAS